MDGVEVDPDHPYDKLYTERFSHYGGASIYAVDASGNATSVLPATVSPWCMAMPPPTPWTWIRTVWAAPVRPSTPLPKTTAA